MTLEQQIWNDILAMSTDELRALAAARQSTPFTQALIESGALDSDEEELVERVSQPTKPTGESSVTTRSSIGLST